jgi:hypothetical protein
MNFTEFIKMIEKIRREALADDSDDFMHGMLKSMNLLDAVVVWKLYNMQENAEKWTKRLTIVGIVLSIIGTVLAILAAV